MLRCHEANEDQVLGHLAGSATNQSGRWWPRGFDLELLPDEQKATLWVREQHVTWNNRWENLVCTVYSNNFCKDTCWFWVVKLMRRISNLWSGYLTLILGGCMSGSSGSIFTFVTLHVSRAVFQALMRWICIQGELPWLLQIAWLCRKWFMRWMCGCVGCVGCWCSEIYERRSVRCAIEMYCNALS